MAGPFRIAVVCLGNICRSPIAQVVLQDEIDRAGISEHIEVASAGTGGWHAGEPMDPRAAGVLSAIGLDGSRHRAQQFGRRWFDRDLILVMDAINLDDVQALAPKPQDRKRVRLLLDFDPSSPAGAEVPDPWYGDRADFEKVLRLSRAAAVGLVKELVNRRPWLGK